MHFQVRRKKPSKILTPTGGFLAGYSHSLNPYGGCSFACSYCYVRRMPVSLFRGVEWGTWVDIKTGADEQLRKELRAAKRKGSVTIFMSSATDPYQPMEAKEEVTRRLLAVMAAEPPDFLFVQTRSPLVTRDIDLFLAIRDRVRISVTVETDREEMRRLFTPSAPPIAARLKALRTCKEAGLDVQAAVSPLLPFSHSFPQTLREVTDKVCLDHFATGDGSGGKRTEVLGIRNLYEREGLLEWYRPEALRRAYEQFRNFFEQNHIRISKDGFLPEG